jgi:hypothetical protein
MAAKRTQEDREGKRGPKKPDLKGCYYESLVTIRMDIAV